MNKNLFFVAILLTMSCELQPEIHHEINVSNTSIPNVETIYQPQKDEDQIPVNEDKEELSCVIPKNFCEIKEEFCEHCAGN